MEKTSLIDVEHTSGSPLMTPRVHRHTSFHGRVQLKTVPGGFRLQFMNDESNYLERIWGGKRCVRSGLAVSVEPRGAWQGLIEIVMPFERTNTGGRMCHGGVTKSKAT